MSASLRWMRVEIDGDQDHVALAAAVLAVEQIPGR